jgi:hypothetical protein
MVVRSLHRWFHGLPVDDVAYPYSVLYKEQTTTNLTALSTLPVFLDYNSQMTGHGDRRASIWLCGKLQAMGGNIEQLWPPPEKEFLWGERERAQLEPMFDWIVKEETNGGQTHFSHPAAQGIFFPESIKDSLLKGFAVRAPQDPELATWLNQWSSLWKAYRGADLPKVLATTPEPATVVTSRVLNDHDLEDLSSGSFFPGNPQIMATNTKRPVQNGQIFGFRLTQARLPTIVEVFRGSNATGTLPRIDLLVDGCCKGALWEKVNEKWIRVNVWL